MKILFQCNTVFQLMIALNIRAHFFKDCFCDALISDIIVDGYKIMKRLQNMHFFNNVYFQKIRNLHNSKRQSVFAFNFEKKRFVNADGNLLNEKYDKIFLVNTSFANGCLLYFLKKRNKKIEINFYEDGLATYSKHYEECYIKNLRGFKSLFYMRKFFKNAKNLYLLTSDYLMRKPEQNIILIPNFLKIDNCLLNIINYVFDYKKGIIPSDCKTIFFEEGFFGDGKPVNDIEIIQICMKYFGSNGFYVKTHPRNYINRFENTSIKTLKTSNIPWELIILNEKDVLNDINLISISSAAIFTPFILFNMRIKTYSCINLINDYRYLFKFVPDVEKMIISKNSNFVYLENGINKKVYSKGNFYE